MWVGVCIVCGVPSGFSVIRLIRSQGGFAPQMANRAYRRVNRELAQMYADPPPGVGASPNDDDLTSVTAYISGPDDSPYEGGRFYLSIVFPDLYPFRPPRCTFLTRVYHPNISSRGQISLDFFNPSLWSPSCSLSKLLLSITSILCDPNTVDSLRVDLAEQYTTDRKAFNAEAKKWTQRYAIGNSREMPNANEVAPKRPLAKEKDWELY